MVINEDFENFYTEVVQNNNVLRLTIPKKLADGAGYKPGDKLKVWIRKVEKEE